MIYEAQLTYTSDDGKSVKESFIVDGFDLFAEVEAKIIEELGGYADADVVAIKRSRIKEIANTRANDDEKIFIATLVDVVLNDDGSEKELKYTIAFFSKNIDTAHTFIQEYSSQGYNMGITQIKETRFIDVIKFDYPQ